MQILPSHPSHCLILGISVLGLCRYFLVILDCLILRISVLGLCRYFLVIFDCIILRISVLGLSRYCLVILFIASFSEYVSTAYADIF